MTKRLITGLLLLACSGSLWAQSPTPSASPAKVKAPASPGKTITDFKTELKMSDAQVAQIQSTVSNLRKLTEGLQQQIMQAEQEAAKLLIKRADTTAIIDKVRTSELLRFNLRYLDVVTARQIENILTPEQVKGWGELQKRAREEQKK